MSDIRIEPLAKHHLDDLLKVETLCFPTPWTRETFLYELESNKLAHYWVALLVEEVIGYAGMWYILDEGHITNIAVHPLHRREGVGSKLLHSLLLTAIASSLMDVTLEVRRSNQAAIALYERYGFQVEGVRKAYYADNGEDALIMWRHFDES